MGRDIKLTDKERKFAEEYVTNGYKAIAAYLVAYPNAKEDTAKGDAWRVLKRDRVRTYIHELEKDAFEANCINAEHIANELAKLAFSDEKDMTTYKVQALNLLQKQLGLQSTKIDAKVDNTTTIKVSLEDINKE